MPRAQTPAGQGQPTFGKLQKGPWPAGHGVNSH
eukprot:CAMPEP_0117576688 /NCGR_PEP_ID=MMETSP0784-20121206/62952_1 /TAXON_ID=39447 /ORGANISM="" /LENGTH=32 /DNA_ID= /DNA_START= /DNA_END= /DNA_ORIENTATION=